MFRFTPARRRVRTAAAIAAVAALTSVAPLIAAPAGAVDAPPAEVTTAKIGTGWEGRQGIS